MLREGEDGLSFNDFRRKQCFDYRWIVFWRFLGVSFRSNINIGFYEYTFFDFRVTRSISVMSVMTAACGLQYEARADMSSFWSSVASDD
jgi:hypothetical protein